MNLDSISLSYSFSSEAVLSYAQSYSRLIALIHTWKAVAACRYFQFFIGFLMGNLAKEAVEGLQEKLQQMQEQGKFVSEKASAAR